MDADERRWKNNENRKWIAGRGRYINPTDGHIFYTEYHLFYYDKNINTSGFAKRAGFTDTICPCMRFFPLKYAHDTKVITEKELFCADKNGTLPICRDCLNAICNNFVIEDGIIKYRRQSYEE